MRKIAAGSLTLEPQMAAHAEEMFTVLGDPAIGLAYRAVSAMLEELVERYQVRMFLAVLKRENGRSLRLLERLGFTAASSEMHDRRQVGHDELLMLRG